MAVLYIYFRALGIKNVTVNRHHKQNVDSLAFYRNKFSDGVSNNLKISNILFQGYVYCV